MWGLWGGGGLWAKNIVMLHPRRIVLSFLRDIFRMTLPTVVGNGPPTDVLNDKPSLTSLTRIRDRHKQAGQGQTEQGQGRVMAGSGLPLSTCYTFTFHITYPY